MILNRQLFVKLVLDDTNEIKIDRVRRVPSWTRLFNWINKQVLPNLYIFREVMGSDYLDDVISIQEGRLKEIKQKMLEQYIDEVGERDKS